MGVFSKLKNIFYDEEYIDEPEAEIKKVDKVVKKELEDKKKKYYDNYMWSHYKTRKSVYKEQNFPTYEQKYEFN